MIYRIGEHMNEHADNEEDFEDCQHYNLSSFDETILMEDGNEVIRIYYQCLDCGYEWHA